MVTITGTNFNSLTAPGNVAFLGVAASTYTVNSSSTVIFAVAPRRPLTGDLTPAAGLITVTTPINTCTANYAYIAAPAGPGGACVEDFLFPSPTTGATAAFAYCMGGSGTTNIKVWNVIGDLVAKLEQTTPAGSQSATLNTARLAPGVYLYRIEKNFDSGATDRSKIRKFVVQH
jgi:hypothetical protein